MARKKKEEATVITGVGPVVVATQDKIPGEVSGDTFRTTITFPMGLVEDLTLIQRVEVRPSFNNQVIAILTKYRDEQVIKGIIPDRSKS